MEPNLSVWTLCYTVEMWRSTLFSSDSILNAYIRADADSGCDVLVNIILIVSDVVGIHLKANPAQKPKCIQVECIWKKFI